MSRLAAFIWLAGAPNPRLCPGCRRPVVVAFRDGIPGYVHEVPR